MGSKLANKKRKAESSDSESENELAEGAFDGVLSASEDDLDFELDDDDSDEEEESEGSEDGTDGEEEDDALLSDDIPSDVDNEDEIGKILKETEELEIEEPGVDPKPKDNGDEDRNYRIEKDANGNERYVYECAGSQPFLCAPES